MQYQAGTWVIDQAHSEVSFWVRHLMISKVRGSFKTFSGQIITTENPEETQIVGQIDVNSITTNDDGRDNHLRSADFFDTENYPTITFNSTSVKSNKNDKYELNGEITIKGVTRPIVLTVTFEGFIQDPYGQTKAAVSATAEINRTDFGLKWNQILDNGAGVLVGETIYLTLEAQATLQK